MRKTTTALRMMIPLVACCVTSIREGVDGDTTSEVDSAQCSPADDSYVGVDRDCPCSAASDSACYVGPDGTRGVGRCVDGVAVCTEDSVIVSCVGWVGPAPEACNGVDDDCDGQTDEEGICDPAAQESEDCDNGIDDDGNDRADCADSACSGLPSCARCTDGGLGAACAPEGVDQSCSQELACYLDDIDAAAGVCAPIEPCGGQAGDCVPGELCLAMTSALDLEGTPSFLGTCVTPSEQQAVCTCQTESFFDCSGM